MVVEKGASVLWRFSETAVAEIRDGTTGWEDISYRYTWLFFLEILFILSLRGSAKSNQIFWRNHLHWSCINTPIFSEVDMKIQREELLLSEFLKACIIQYVCIKEHFYHLRFSNKRPGKRRSVCPCRSTKCVCITYVMATKGALEVSS